ncbi:MAG: beta-ketoacyl synthase N-terminal-like domain-containing protein [Deltaproteobacteria bacterium]
MRAVAVSGVGVVCPGTIGRRALESGLGDGRVAGRPPRLGDLELESFLRNARPFRRGAQATRSALAAAALALDDAGIGAGELGGERAGLVVGVTHGAINYSTQFHRELLAQGPAGASPLFFAESVLNAPAGNGAIAFGIRGPVHTLIGDETVGTQAIDLAAFLLDSETVERCLVVGTEEWSDVVRDAYGRAGRLNRESGDGAPEPPSEAAAALVLELPEAAARRGAVPRAVISGWTLGRGGAGRMESAIADAVRDGFRRCGPSCAAADHVVLPTGPYRAAARRGIVLARGSDAPPVREVDLRPLAGHPVGAANLLQVAASATLLSAGRLRGPGLVVAAGLERTVSAAVLTAPGGAGP